MNWFILSAGIIGLIFGAFTMHEMDVISAARGIERQKQDDVKQCSMDKKLTEEIDHDTRKKLDAVTAERNALRVRRPATCLPVARHTGGNNDPGTAQHAAAHGIDTDWLYDIAAEGDTYGTALLACQDFVKKERALKSSR